MQEGHLLPGDQQDQGWPAPIQALLDFVSGLQGLPLESGLLRQESRKEDYYHLLPRQIRTHDLPYPQQLGPAHEAASAGHHGAGAGHALKLYGHVQGQHSGAGPQRNASGRCGL